MLPELSKHQNNKLQSLINTTARLIPNARKYGHINSDLRKLLKVDERIDYNVLQLMLKCLSYVASVYLSRELEMLSNISGMQKLKLI